MRSMVCCQLCIQYKTEALLNEDMWLFYSNKPFVKDMV